MFCSYAIILLTVRMKCLYILVLYINCIKCTFDMHLVMCEDCKHTRIRFTCIMTMLLAAFFLVYLCFILPICMALHAQAELLHLHCRSNHIYMYGRREGGGVVGVCVFVFAFMLFVLCIYYVYIISLF